MAPAEIDPAEIGPDEVGPPEVGPAEKGPGERCPNEVGPAEIGFGEIEMCGVNALGEFPSEPPSKAGRLDPMSVVSPIVFLTAGSKTNLIRARHLV